MVSIAGSNKQQEHLASSRLVVDTDYNSNDDLLRINTKKITFFKNGDQYFTGKTVSIQSNRYVTFRDLMNDLNRTVDLPYGVRRIYTPIGGKEVRRIDELNDGQSYVCASFEPFRYVKYGDTSGMMNSNNSTIHPHRHDINGNHISAAAAAAAATILPSVVTFGNPNGGLSSNTTQHNSQQHQLQQQQQPGYYIPRQYVRTFPGAKRTTQNSFAPSSLNQTKQQVGLSGQLGGSEAWSKPRLITVIKAGDKPRKKVSILLNRKAVHSYEQFICDISDAFGLPQWKNDKIRKLYSLKGRRIQAISDFFRDDDIFIAISAKEVLTKNMVKDLLEDLYPENPYSQTLLKNWDKTAVKKPSSQDTLNQTQRDSGFGEDEAATQQQQSQPITDQLHTHREPLETKVNDENLNKKKIRKPKKNADENTSNGNLNSINEIESQRYKDRLKLIEEEKKKKHVTVVTPTPVVDQNKNTSVLNELNHTIVPKKLKRKPKFKQNLNTSRNSEENSQQETHTHANATPSAVVPIIGESRKSSLVLPKIEPTVIVAKAKPKIKRQISSLKHITERYEIGKTLGDGNFAVVKQARLKNTDNTYAIKIIDKSKMRGKEHMIENEIHIMKSCNHANIVKLYEEFETLDEVYLITDLVKGGDLFDAITQSVKFSERDASCMIRDLVDALFYLHSKNIVHRDLKPENLLVMRRKDSSINIKLADFGLAMEVKTPIFTVCGTPTYVAPEILAETGYGLEVDLWATGVIAYILLCGFPPFRSLDRNQEELFQYIQAGEFEYLMPYWEGISEASKDLINHLLVVDVKKRWKAEDVLTHPWILSHGNSRELPSNLEEYQKKVLNELKLKAKQYASEPIYK